ncbi:MAG: hypothetical protein FJW27_13245 [Acidimicrobiia bacterium]|nr:hypothetical protein [Acidimicrobiia bacterium]
MRRLWALAVVPLLVATPASADLADFLGKPVARVVVEVEGRPVNDSAMLALLVSEAGKPLRMRDVRASVAHLFSLGRFADVVVHAAVTANGSVSVRYELIPIHEIERMQFAGLAGVAGVDEAAVREALVERFGALPPATRATEMGAFVAEQLQERGYRRASVSARTQLEHTAERSTLVFEVTSGPRTTVSEIRVVGTGMPPDQVIRRLGVARGTAYEPGLLAGRLERIVDTLKQQGHYNARATVTPQFSEDDRVASVLVSVAPGPKIRVEFSGDPLPPDRRDDLVPVAREGAADEDLLEDSAQRIQEFFRSQGYRDATATFTRETQGDDLVVRFTMSRGPLYRVARVDIAGNISLSTSDLAPALRLRDGQVFSAAVLSAQASAIQDIYARRGFPAARAVPDAQPLENPPGPQQVLVVVRIEITEGVRTVVGTVRIEGNTSLATATLTEGLGLQPGEPFYRTQLVIDQDAIQLKYANAGFRSATVSSSPGLSEDGTVADVRFTVEEGPQVFVDHVLIVGNRRTNTDTIRRELQFKSGDPLGLAAIAESQRRLATLGLFRRTRVTELGHGTETSRDVLITVEEAPVTTIGYGGGLETKPVLRGSAAAGGFASEQLEFAPRAFFEVGRRNLFGKNRSVNAFTRVSFRPQNFGGQSTSTAAGGYGFSEYRVLGTYREPRVRNTAADAFLTGTVEQQRRATFNFARRAFTAELLRRITRQTSVTGNYQLQRTELFDERIAENDRLLVDRLFPQVRLSSFSLSAIRDARDDLIDPTSGTYLSANAQVAGRRIGSEVGYLKSYWTGQLFRSVPELHRMVVATSVRVGVASGFPRVGTIVDDEGKEVSATVRDLPASERFFAGGDTTVRGYALDQLGTADTLTGGFPKGGNALVVFNAELRLPVGRGLGLVGFFDTGNVFARTAAIDLGQLRSSLGFGVRYRSPVGPIRVDMGFKANRRPGEDPTAVHISLGQAF